MQMSFLIFLTHIIIPYSNKNKINRKEHNDSLIAEKYTPLIIPRKERASAFTSKGSMTLEAAIVVPLFFFAVLCLGYLIEIMATQNTIYNGLCSAAKELAMQGYTEGIVTTKDIEKRIVSNIGAERLDNSMIAGGIGGIDCSESVCNWATGVMKLSVKYQLEIPVLMFRIRPVSCKESIRVKGWCGYVSGTDEFMTENMVYVTDTGLVYHKDRQCTYLDMSVRMVRCEQVEQMRNQSGGNYYPCESCRPKKNELDICYVTDYGTRYHGSLQCKKIQRNIYAVPLDETYGLGGCSKCVK